MRNTHMAFLAILLVLVLYPLSLFSASLDEIIQSAYASSDEMKRYELDKRNADLAVSIGEAKDELGIEVSSGNVTAEYQPDYNAYVFNTSGPEATFTLPNDGKTAIKVGTGSIAYSPDGNVFSLKPSASVSHSILLGDSSDNRSSLLNKQNKLLGTYSYQSNLIQFENSIINQISSLLTNQKSINETMKNIVIQQKAMSDALALKTVGKDSVAYQEQVHTLANLESTLASLQGNKTLLESQYTQLTSLSWDGIPVLREPKLDFEKNPNGNTSVALKALALDIANEDLKLAKANLTNKTVGISGGVGFSASDTGSLLKPQYSSYGVSGSNGITANVGTTYSANNYSFGGSVSGSYNVDTKDFSPKLTVSGSWNNNATQLTETLNIQKLENNAMLASITYNDALQEYLYTASSLQSQIAAWKLEYSLLESSASYHVQALEQQQALFAKGLTTKSNVDIARFTVEQDSYDRALTLLKGLVIENSIRSLQIQGR